MHSEILKKIRKDCEDGLPNLRTAHVFTSASKRHRLPDAAANLVEHPGDSEAVEIFLTELCTRHRILIGNSKRLGKRFAQAVHELEEEVMDALPGHTQRALAELIELTPVELVDARMMAHALVTEGDFVTWLLDGTEKKPKEKGDPKKLFRKLAAKYHPDHGGDGEVMADLNLLRDAMEK